MSFELTQNLKTLEGLMTNLKPKDREFAKSLIGFYKSKGKLSDKQQPWIDTLIERAAGKDEPDLFQPTPLENPANLYGFLGKSPTKYPEVVLLTPSGAEFKIYRTGKSSKYPGTLSIVLLSPETWLGRIDKDGTFAPNPKVANTPGWAEIVLTIRHFSTNPAKAASEYGKITGRCCFCFRKLEDGFSTAIGYGPVCAKNYGLPWGSKALKAEEVH